MYVSRAFFCWYTLSACVCVRFHEYWCCHITLCAESKLRANFNLSLYRDCRRFRCTVDLHALCHLPVPDTDVAYLFHLTIIIDEWGENSIKKHLCLFFLSIQLFIYFQFLCNDHFFFVNKCYFNGYFLVSVCSFHLFFSSSLVSSVFVFCMWKNANLIGSIPKKKNSINLNNNGLLLVLLLFFWKFLFSFYQFK